MEEPVIKYLESSRRSELEKQRLNALGRQIDDNLGGRIANLEKAILLLDANVMKYMLSIAESLVEDSAVLSEIAAQLTACTRILDKIGGKDG